MHVNHLQDFLDYKPVFDDKPQQIVDEIISLAEKYLPKKDIANIQPTYEFAKSAHETWKRHSGEPYIVHPLKATIFLLAIKPDISTIQACILHDVIEDTEIPYETILKEFWKDVADLCEWLVKVSKVRYQWEERHIENWMLSVTDAVFSSSYVGLGACIQGNPSTASLILQSGVTITNINCDNDKINLDGWKQEGEKIVIQFIPLSEGVLKGWLNVYSKNQQSRIPFTFMSVRK